MRTGEKSLEKQVDGVLVGELNIRIGKLEFSGKGQQAWLAEQLKIIVAAIPNIPASDVDGDADKAAIGSAAAPKFMASLASHIKAKNAVGNQTQRFLVAADWLRLRGMETVTTTAVAKALTDNHQSRLGNPADCLNKNVAKGLCEKVKGGFYITPEGLRELGYP